MNLRSTWRKTWKREAECVLRGTKQTEFLQEQCKGMASGKKNETK